MSALTTNRQTSTADEKTGNQHSRTGTPGASLRVSAALHESGSVQVLGRLHDEPIHAHRGQASEKRQGTKSRAGGSPTVQAGYGELASRCTVRMVDLGGANDAAAWWEDRRAVF